MVVVMVVLMVVMMMVVDAWGHAMSRWAPEWGFIDGMLMAESNVYCGGNMGKTWGGIRPVGMSDVRFVNCVS